MITRRALLATPAFAAAAGQPRPDSARKNPPRGIRILPGQWRPHYPWEQIAWVSPPWSSQDYIWLDFPEAIFSDRGLLFLSHISLRFPAMFSNLPRVKWRPVDNGLAFERRLPNGISFGGSVTRSGESEVDLALHLENATTEPLRNIALQTCAYLRGIREFADFTAANKYVHLRSEGWVPLDKALDMAPRESAPYIVGWRTHGKKMADLPVLVTLSNQAERLVAMTWYGDTLSLISNPDHPCMHADPRFSDLKPGERGAVRGKLIFFEGKLADFDLERFGQG